jgi:transposase
MARRRQLVDMLGAEPNRRRQVRDRGLQRHLDAHIAWLEEALRRLDQDLTTLVRSTPAWRDADDLLRSVPGIAAGRPGKVAVTAAMRKLLTILNAMLPDRRPWQPA